MSKASRNIVKSLFKKNVILILLLCSIKIYSSESSFYIGLKHTKEVNDRFREAVRAGNTEDVFRMLNDPATFSLINVNAIRDEYDYSYLMYACTYGFQNMVEKLLTLKRPDGSLLVDVNRREGVFGSTTLMCACTHGYQKIVEKLLEFKKPDGSLLVDINARNCNGQTAFMIACYVRRLGIIKSLLAHEVDMTMFPNARNLHALPESLGKKNILSVFDALKPGIKDVSGTFLEGSIVEAYGQFLQGNHTELRNLLLVAPDAVQRRISDGTEERKRCVGYRDTLMRSMRSVFKKESIKPLLYFLAEKQYQRTMVEVLVDRIQPGLEDNFPVDHLWYNQ